MGNYKEVEGNLITLALEGAFDVVVHGCNCFCTMGAGIAPHMAKAFGCDDYPLEEEEHRGDINKLGCIEFGYHELPNKRIYPVNAYTQYGFGRNHDGGKMAPVDYEAITLCMRKINNYFEGKHIGLPLIGCGLAGGDWARVEKIIKAELVDCDVTIVHFKQQENVSEHVSNEAQSS
jgi:O-acetyl-ADP-ribose deacetylase (regulator of RNase III)